MPHNTEKTNAIRIAERSKIPFTIQSYDHSDGQIDGLSVAAKLGQKPESVFKTLVTRGASKNLYVFVIPVGRELHLKRAAKSVGEKSIEMIKVSELTPLTGYIRGGCSPIGMKKLYRTILDSSAEKQERIYVSAGKIGLQIGINPRELAGLVKAEFSSVTEEPEELQFTKTEA